MNLTLPPEALQIMREHGMADFAEQLEQDSPVRQALKKFITQHPAMLRMKEEVYKLSKVNDPVLIIGPTGTGKELIARALHGDRTGNYYPINCAGLTPALVESELFGHEQGAFTGATKKKEGIMLKANQGSVFLDEIGELPLEIQPKLLRAIQERCIRSVGGEKEVAINCRFIFATHKNLETMCEEGKFREDLFYRINTFDIHTTPLEERVGDVPLIIKALDKDNKIEDIDEFCAGINIKQLKGNVRMLEKFVRNYLVLGKLPQMKAGNGEE